MIRSAVATTGAAVGAASVHADAEAEMEVDDEKVNRHNKAMYVRKV